MSNVIMGVYKQEGQPDKVVPISVDESGQMLTQGSGGSSTGITDAQLRASPVSVSMASAYAEDTAHTSGATGHLVFGVRSDADTAGGDNGDYIALTLDEESRLKVSTKPASYSTTTGNITSASSAVFVNTQRFSNLMIHCSGTFAGVQCTFEGSINSTNGTDGNWFSVQAIRSSSNAIETSTGVLSVAPAYAWELSVNALKYFRIRSTAWTSGTQVWTLAPGSYATEPIPAAQVSATQPVSGSVSVSNLPATQTVSGTVAVSSLPAISSTPVTPTSFILNSASGNNPNLIKASAGTIYNVACSNVNNTVCYVKLYNLGTAPTVGTSISSFVITVPAGGQTVIDFGALGQRFSTGISLSITSGLANNDASSVSAGFVKLLVSYI